MNQSEEYAFSIARRSSLTLWSYATPAKGTTGKELCDALIMFGQDIAILSVKDVRLTGKSQVDLQRWSRRAIEGSVKQIYGAQRWLRSATHIVRADGSQGLPLPPAHLMNIHRIAVAFGSEAQAPIQSGDFGKGFTHVFDDKAFDIILGELDTASDLFAYLTKKVGFLSTGPHVLLEGGEEDLLATYLASGRAFPTASDIVSVGSGIWDDFSARPEYFAKKKADEVSRVWDNLIEEVAQYALSGTLEFGSSLTHTEQALRVMATEDRYQRRLLGRAFEDFLQQSATSIRSRLMVSSSGTTYVFLATPHGADRRDRGVELMARCYAARGRVPLNPTVVGIATEQYLRGKGHSLDLFCMVKPDWTPEDQRALDCTVP